MNQASEGAMVVPNPVEREGNPFFAGSIALNRGERIGPELMAELERICRREPGAEQAAETASAHQ